MSIEELRARSRRMPANGLFSGRTAAWLHGLDFPWEPIEVTLPRLSRTSHLAGVRLWRSDYTSADCCEVRGLPATSRTRTVADMARRARVIEAVPIVDMAVRARSSSKTSDDGSTTTAGIEGLDAWPKHLTLPTLEAKARWNRAFGLCSSPLGSPSLRSNSR